MGLPLYKPPAEAAAKSPPATEKRSEHARSLIRRSQRARTDALRERHRRIMANDMVQAALQNELRSRLPPDGPSVPGQRPTIPPGRTSLRDLARGLLGDRAARTAREGSYRADPADTVAYGAAAHDMSPPQTETDADWRERPGEPYPTSYLRSTQNPNIRVGGPATTAPFPRGAYAVYGPDAAGDDARRRLDEALMNQYRPSPPMPWRHQVPTPGPLEGERANDVDGLGDRNRSLSPEGDNVWDTLLNTVTPDPQPPSVGSSFASSTAFISAAASQSAAAGSSGTPLTSPDAADEAGLEQACESSWENSDTEGDDDDNEGDADANAGNDVDVDDANEDDDEEEDDVNEDDDDEMQENILTRFPTIVPVDDGERRSYADVTRHTGTDDPLALLGGIGGMQHIVRSLARREDIPDEWWAEAGLSRTLPREDSPN